MEHLVLIFASITLVFLLNNYQILKGQNLDTNDFREDQDFLEDTNIKEIQE